MDRTDFPSTPALLAACAKQEAVARAALALLDLMSAAADHGAEDAFDDDRAAVQATFHDVISARCMLLGELAHEAGYASGAELRALGRQLNLNWQAQHEARVRAAMLQAAE